MPNRINASQIKSEFDSVIAHADTIEPQLAERPVTSKVILTFFKSTLLE